MGVVRLERDQVHADAIAIGEPRLIVEDAAEEEELNPEEAVVLEKLFQGFDPKPPWLIDVCTTLMQMLENTKQAVVAGTYRIPVEYAFSWDTFERVPMEQWCEGMLLADQWLEPFWMHGLARLNRTDSWAYAKLVEELDETVGLIRLLSDIDAALDKLERNPEDDWMHLREEIKDSYDTIDRYLLRYMGAGNSLASYFVLRKPQVREMPKIGRNELCPCGSGLKYKKCCISAEN